jgi:bifunctional DNA-binding transcriptional regulator/antitoxin component of YhaV-PrlF toxin-antitoxin module
MSKLPKKLDGTRYEVIVTEDDNGDLLLPLPPAMLEQLGWGIGDELDFNVDTKGRYILSKVNK